VDKSFMKAGVSSLNC